MMQEESQLCAKKEIIFEKFNELLKKLGHENVERNASDQVCVYVCLIASSATSPIGGVEET